jgi:hypothetical protein
MDGQTRGLEEKLERLLREAAEVSVALDRANGTIQGVPHYTLIEQRAHDLGRQLSRRVQERHMGEMLAFHMWKAACPQCGTRCEVVPSKRRVTSVDGPIEFPELEGHCPSCRKSFFPAAGDIGD